MTISLLRARLTLPLDRFALDVDLQISDRITGIFGPSGAGKTSLVESIAGLRHARGTITVGDLVLQDHERGIHLPPEGRHIGLVPQESSLFPHMTVQDNLKLAALRAARQGKSPDQEIDRAVAVLALGPLLSRWPLTLSGGERRRVALARALCSAPGLLVLDEPLASLDLTARHALLPVLRETLLALEIPVLLVSHDPLEIQCLCTHVIALRDGRILTSGTPRRVMSDPRVLPYAGDRGFRNVFPGTTTQSAEAPGINLSARLTLFTRPHPDTDQAGGQPASTALVEIGARDIVVARTAPVGLSARNVLPCTIESIQPIDGDGAHVLVWARIDDELDPIAIELSGQAVRTLGLDARQTAHLIIKASACTLFLAG